jgi:hypothetical protein
MGTRISDLGKHENSRGVSIVISSAISADERERGGERRPSGNIGRRSRVCNQIDSALPATRYLSLPGETRAHSRLVDVLVLVAANIKNRRLPGVA